MILSTAQVYTEQSNLVRRCARPVGLLKDLRRHVRAKQDAQH